MKRIVFIGEWRIKSRTPSAKPTINSILFFLMGRMDWLGLLRRMRPQGNSPTIQFHQSLMKIDWELNVLLFHWWGSEPLKWNQIDWKEIWWNKMSAVSPAAQPSTISLPFINKPKKFGFCWMKRVVELAKRCTTANKPFTNQIKICFVHSLMALGRPAGIRSLLSSK